MDEAGFDWDKTLFVSGIGCAAWIPSPHFNADTLHTMHGRPIAFGTGAKIANPELNIVIASGDGDLAAIGGNHLIHAARRNLNLTVICANNHLYGMTGGQVAPTTPIGAFTQTSPWGGEEPPFDLCNLIRGAGGAFVARNTVFQIRQLIKNLSNALQFDGFSFVEAVSPCPTHYGKLNKIPTLGEFRERMKGIYIDRRKWDKMTPEEQAETIPTGVWNVDIFKPPPPLHGGLIDAVKAPTPLRGGGIKGGGQRGMKNRLELIICGFGGQGVIFAGVLLGRAGMHAGLEAAQSASYGSEARGSACHAGVVLSSELIGYPKVRQPDILLAMSQAAYDKFRPMVKPGGMVFFDCHLIKMQKIDDIEQIGIPATSVATQLGSKAMANVVMLSAAVAGAKIVSVDALKIAIEEQSPKAFKDVNIKAFEEGLKLGTMSAAQI